MPSANAKQLGQLVTPANLVTKPPQLFECFLLRRCDEVDFLAQRLSWRAWFSAATPVACVAASLSGTDSGTLAH